MDLITERTLVRQVHRLLLRNIEDEKLTPCLRQASIFIVRNVPNIKEIMEKENGILH
jgi:hypothetical protein